jgi:hypothetical protein
MANRGFDPDKLVHLKKPGQIYFLNKSYGRGGWVAGGGLPYMSMAMGTTNPDPLLHHSSLITHYLLSRFW